MNMQRIKAMNISDKRLLLISIDYELNKHTGQCYASGSLERLLKRRGIVDDGDIVNSSYLRTLKSLLEKSA